ncbi:MULTISPECIES: DUF3347 domain-containing protein [Olivibacter]|uniref:DUF3347 domain-containing protein n=1 Tax=Olivibacter oleidegradans TaxID=760123 RepID=A0ABV6HR84_9SPHI|nr:MULTISPECIES: DUF3347 domain-containing protein [Olivibacter]QEL03972.1 DUF3347 domain-containing protein [Olivibacter sp. LS-1]
MKNLIFGVMAVTAFTFAACNSNSEKKTDDHQNMETMENVEHQAADGNTNITEIKASFTDVDPKVASSIKQIVDHYIHVKTALSNDDDKEAASGGEAMVAAMNQLDKSVLTAEQAALYNQNEADLKEHAEHIGENVGNINHQREHFIMMSEDVYALVKGFGAGRTLYNAHCPMAKDNEGAMWLTESNEIKNPYFGSKMLKCGSVKEVIN